MTSEDFMVVLEEADNGWLAILYRGRHIVGRHVLGKEFKKEELGEWVEGKKPAAP